MRTAFLASTILVGIWTVGSVTSWAQAQPEQGFRVSSADLAVTFNSERTKLTPGTGDNFWLHGGSLDAGVVLLHGLGVAANFTAEDAESITPGVNLNKLAFMAGPRYTFRLGAKHQDRLFVESLFGAAHARDGAFPTSTGVATSADSFAFQLGGGWDIPIRKDITVRAFEADFVHTNLPNRGSNTQDYLRLAFGVSYHIPRH